MICNKCKTRNAHIIIIDVRGEYKDDGVLCCWCFVREFKEMVLDVLNKIGGGREN